MPDNLSKIKKLGRQLYPNGRAFWMPENGEFDLLNDSVAESEERAFNDAVSILNSVIADNPAFADDVEAWERRLGIITAPGVAIEDRIKAINLKLNYPVTDAPRQHYLYLQEQLRLAGFDVYVHENKFGGIPKTPEEWLSPLNATLHSETTLHATSTFHRATSFIGTYHSDEIFHSESLYHGSKFDNIVANHVDKELDYEFVIGDNYRSTFYISAQTMPEFAIVNPAREQEFRQMILQLKPVQTVALLFINYQ